MTSTYINHAWGGQQDRPIIQYAYPLILFGLLAIASSGRSVHVEPFYFFYKQLLFCLSGIVIYLIGQKIGSHRWCFEFKHLWPLMVLLLILPLSPLGSEINGAKRWLQLFGFGFQPTEFVKVMWVFFISKFAYDYHLVLQKDMFSTSFMWLKLLVILSLMLMQPDFGSMAVLLFLTLAILFVAKVRIDFFFALVIICLIICVGLILVAPYRAARVIAFLDPWAHSQGQGYQLIASLIALGSGGFFGKGLGLSSQKYRALPEAHTDFVFSIIGEEMGLVGAGVLFYLMDILSLFFLKKH